eukprot:TRINITY_DN4252_c0_g1_i1.p1 TRINITY_DN4252_c0_g1~~TRINITY_DN4252_c0_g1_i1.p1  ORF type:complete len:574 (-),score=99.92 TRINITY_DN4252_c0_g1_i1:86-1780(-)
MEKLECPSERWVWRLRVPASLLGKAGPGAKLLGRLGPPELLLAVLCDYQCEKKPCFQQSSEWCKLLLQIHAVQGCVEMHYEDAGHRAPALRAIRRCLEAYQGFTSGRGCGLGKLALCMAEHQGILAVGIGGNRVELSRAANLALALAAGERRKLLSKHSALTSLARDMSRAEALWVRTGDRAELASSSPPSERERSPLSTRKPSPGPGSKVECKKLSESESECEEPPEPEPQPEPTPSSTLKTTSARQAALDFAAKQWRTALQKSNRTQKNLAHADQASHTTATAAAQRRMNKVVPEPKPMPRQKRGDKEDIPPWSRFKSRTSAMSVLEEERPAMFADEPDDLRKEEEEEDDDDDEREQGQEQEQEQEDEEQEQEGVWSNCNSAYISEQEDQDEMDEEEREDSSDCENACASEARPPPQGAGTWRRRAHMESRDRVRKKDDVNEVDIGQVYFTQKQCSRCFRDGRSLDELVQLLSTGEVDPLKDSFLIINVIQAWEVDYSGKRKRTSQPVYYALDHRRLHCMREAGCSRIRVRLQQLANSAVRDQFLSKAAQSIGRRTEIKVGH